MEQIAFMETITRYLIDAGPKGCDAEPVKLPSLGDLAKQVGISRGKLREELIAAQAYGVVEMRPGDGTYVNPFDFHAAVRPAVLYSIACERHNFHDIRDLRAHLEVTYWDAATTALSGDDLQGLKWIVERAERKMQSSPIEIPHDEHRELHLRIFSKLDNPFVLGLLQAYWDAYEAVELHRYFELSYYESMWASHRRLVEALLAGDRQTGKAVLRQHFSILEDRLHSSD